MDGQGLGGPCSFIFDPACYSRLDSGCICHFRMAKGAPGRGYHWGMATPHPNLPRGTRIKVGTSGTLSEILFGPAKTDDGTQNLVGALMTSMGNLGVRNIEGMHSVEIIIAPSIQTEGKVFQAAQRVGMGK